MFELHKKFIARIFFPTRIGFWHTYNVNGIKVRKVIERLESSSMRGKFDVVYIGENNFWWWGFFNGDRISKEEIIIDIVLIRRWRISCLYRKERIRRTTRDWWDEWSGWWLCFSNERRKNNERCRSLSAKEYYWWSGVTQKDIRKRIRTMWCIRFVRKDWECRWDIMWKFWRGCHWEE